ncbi:DNA cytosine methyltransferase [Sodalis sp. RH24]|uniref:DNA cytosine methyltransferase n=1 Tax=unclassified Sodalis (in: enterobacteria) TaxID=2636512 RepID=UPI0039B595EB
MKEIIVDNFAGGGGASTGIEMAIGRSVDIAINHDQNAIDMHSTNHPDTLHYCESVFDVDPVVACSGRPVALAWFSPDCRHFSKAKGSTPVKKEIRGLAWVALRWGLKSRPRVMILENVKEFKTWGPLLTADDGTQHPDPARAGETFAAFVAMLTTGVAANHPALDECCEILGIAADSDDRRRLVAGLGYTVEFRELRASDLGTPTIRERFFMVMRCDDAAIAWPVPTHGNPKSLEVQSGKLKPWRTAAEIIDWSLPCPSIFERKRPLAENTLKRIARGIQRFVIDNPTPFIVKCNHSTKDGSYDCFRGQSIDEPLKTITKTHGYALVSPVIAGAGGPKYQAKPRSVEQPLHTLCNTNHSCVVAPVIARIGQTGFGGDRMAYSPEGPLTTVTSKAEHLLVSAFLAKHFGGNYTGPGASLDEPAHTVTTVDHHALVSAQLVGCGGRAGQSRPRDISEPVQTVTAKADSALVTSHLIKLRGTCKDGQPVTEPLPTITAGGLHIGEVRAFLLKYYGTDKDGCAMTDPLHTVTSNDRFGLVTVAGVDYQIVDIGMRMLQPHELYAAQGFPSWYIIDQDYKGNKYAKDKQVARCGNAVPPPFAEALVRANLPELCRAKAEEAA